MKLTIGNKLNNFDKDKTRGVKSWVLFFALVIFLSPALGDVLCVRKKQVTGDFNKNFRVFRGSRCPSGFAAIINTASFRGPQGAQGPSGIINFQENRNNTHASLATLAGGLINSDLAYEAISFPSFTKQSGDTTIRVTFISHLNLLNDATTTAFCSVQLRLNGATSQGSTSTNFTSDVSGVQTFGSGSVGANQVISTTVKVVGYFTGLPIGNYTPSVWLRGLSVNDCRLNDGIFRNSLIIEEIKTN